LRIPIRPVHYGQGIIMGKGLLAWWRNRIVARGLAGIVLLSVPVAVAATIGFGTSLSGVAGGLSAITNGPDAVTASAPAAGPAKLNRAVVALASSQTSGGAQTTAAGGSSTGGGSNLGTSGGSGGGTAGTLGASGGGSGDGSGTNGPAPTISSPSTPNVTIPGTGGGGTGDTVDSVNSSVDDVVGGVNNTLNGLLGR